MPLYMLSSGKVPEPDLSMMATLGTIVRQCTEKELNLFQPKGKYVSGMYTETFVVSPDRYLPNYAMNNFNGQLIQRRLDSWDDLENE